MPTGKLSTTRKHVQKFREHLHQCWTAPGLRWSRRRRATPCAYRVPVGTAVRAQRGERGAERGERGAEASPRQCHDTESCVKREVRTTATRARRSPKEVWTTAVCFKSRARRTRLTIRLVAVGDVHARADAEHSSFSERRERCQRLNLGVNKNTRRGKKNARNFFLFFFIYLCTSRASARPLWAGRGARTPSPSPRRFLPCSTPGSGS